LAAVVVTLRQ
jgi:hypothetical protein